MSLLYVRTVAKRGEILRSRERMRPWLVHIATFSFAALVLAGPAAAFHWSASTLALGAAAITAAMIVADALRCRRVVFAPEGLTIGGRTFAWDDIADTHVREVPIARAGLFIRLTNEARARCSLGAARYRVNGFGLAPAPNPKLAAARYDFFLRAHRARLETWFAMMSIYQLELGSHARADACLAHVKATVKALIPGKPRAIAAMFAAKPGP